MTFTGPPPLLVTPEIAAWCVENIAALDVVPVGDAGDHATEDRPKEISAERRLGTSVHVGASSPSGDELT